MVAVFPTADMSSGVSSYLSSSFLSSKGIEVTKPLHDWLTRASFLAKNRRNETEQRKYVNWALRTVEETIHAAGNTARVDWKALSPVMPPGASDEPLPKMLQASENSVNGGGDGAFGMSGGGSEARATVLAETLKRAPSELLSSVHKAFSLYDRDVVAGKRRYEQVSSLEMLNLAKNLLQRDRKHQHVLAAAAGVSAVGSATTAPQVNQPRGIEDATPRDPRAHAHSHSIIPNRGILSDPSPDAEATKGRKRARQHDATVPLVSSDGRPPVGERTVWWRVEEEFFSELSTGRQLSSSTTLGSTTPTREGGGVFLGLSTELERSYSRYEPTAEDIRPLPILQKAFAFVRARAEKKAAQEGKTTGLAYLNEQLKGMRQDLRVQNISNNFAVSVYEFHARLCLEIGDLGEFNQCQSVLKRLYVHPDVANKEVCCMSEFFSYRIVYLSLCQQYDALSTELVNYTNELLLGSDVARTAARFVMKEDVRRALRVAAACNEGDCATLLQEIRHFPEQMAFLVRIYLQRLRVGWFQVILCGVRGAISLRFLMANLGVTPIRHSQAKGSEESDAFWLDGSSECAEREFHNLFRTLKIPLPPDFHFREEVVRDTTRDHTGGSRNTAGSVPSLDAATTREIVERYVSFLGTRKDAIGSSVNTSS